MNEELSALVGWRMVYSTMQCWQQCDRRLKRSLARHLLEARFGTLPVFFLQSRRYMMDTVALTSAQLKLGRERPGSVGSNAVQDGD